MIEFRKLCLGVCLAVLAGWASTMAMAAALHALGWVSPAAEQGYPLTNYLQTCVSPGSAIVYCALAVILGCMLRKPWPVAVGMMLPWPIACAIELTRDPTSHNLLPFEAIIAWVPALSLALMGTYGGRWTYERFSSGGEPQKLDLTGQNRK